MNMNRALAVVACSLGLGACSSFSTSWMPSFDLFSSRPGTATLTIESDPPGADAHTSMGASCRTPCSLPVPVADEFTVSYALTGYLPQTISVRPLPGESGIFGTSGTPAQLEPNPVFAALQPAAPAKAPPAKKRKRPSAAAAPAGTSTAAARAAAPPSPPPSLGGFAPPPGAFTPPPR
jgi:hypothetical protein